MNIFIAIHHQIVRDGISRILSDDPEITVTGTVENREQLCSLDFKDDVDILIVDLDMPDLDEEHILEQIHKNNPDIRVLAISDEVGAERIKNVLKAGASGFIFKKREAKELIQAAKEVYNGNQYLCDESIDSLIQEDKRKKLVDSGADLTNREQEVLKLICEEHTNRKIADLLNISVRTVDAHRRNLLQKTGATNTAGLVKFAIKHRLFVMT